MKIFENVNKDYYYYIIINRINNVNNLLFILYK